MDSCQILDMILTALKSHWKLLNAQPYVDYKFKDTNKIVKNLKKSKVLKKKRKQLRNVEINILRKLQKTKNLNPRPDIVI